MRANAYAEPSDDPIVTAIQRGQHREALALCARHHGAPLGRFCMALLGNAAEADEALQETLLAAHDAMSGYRGESSVRGYLYGIARNVCAKRLATRTRRERLLSLVHDASEGPDTPAELVERRARAHRMRLALDTLRPSDREALLLRFDAGLGYRELGALLELDEVTARKRVSRALVRLREAFGDEVG